MGWLSLCVCGTKRNSNDGKTKKDGKRKRNSKKNCKKNSKQKGSCKAPPFIVDEFLRKSQNEQSKEIAEKEWVNGEIVNYFSHCTKNQIDPSEVKDDDHESFERSLENSEGGEGPCDTNCYDGAVLHSRCASSTVDESEGQVKCVSDEREHDEVVDLDESVPRSMTSVEPEDSSWTSEVEDASWKSSFDRKIGERISSRINFSSDKQGKSKTKAVPRKKGTRDIFPPIKGRGSRAADCINNEELQTHAETSKFGFKRTAASDERNEIRRKLNSCSFVVRTHEDEERDGREKGGRASKIRGEGSMIPRLTSPLRQEKNSIKNDSDKSEIVGNGTALRAKNYKHIGYLIRKN